MFAHLANRYKGKQEGRVNHRQPLLVSHLSAPFNYFTYFNLKLLSTTLTLEKAIKALAHMGVI